MCSNVVVAYLDSTVLEKPFFSNLIFRIIIIFKRSFKITKKNILFLFLQAPPGKTRPFFVCLGPNKLVLSLWLTAVNLTLRVNSLMYQRLSQLKIGYGMLSGWKTRAQLQGMYVNFNNSTFYIHVWNCYFFGLFLKCLFLQISVAHSFDEFATSYSMTAHLCVQFIQSFENLFFWCRESENVQEHHI